MENEININIRRVDRIAHQIPFDFNLHRGDFAQRLHWTVIMLLIQVMLLVGVVSQYIVILQQSVTLT